MIVSTEDSESKLIGFEYFQSKTQKRAAQNKLSSISEVKGNSKLSKVIEEKKSLRSKVSSGSGNVEDVLNKLETGELELDGDPVVSDNGDGTVTVRLIVKPL